jgi:hypothetical protein
MTYEPTAERSASKITHNTQWRPSPVYRICAGPSQNASSENAPIADVPIDANTLCLWSAIETCLI